MAIGVVGPCLGLGPSTSIAWGNTVPAASGCLVNCVYSGVSRRGVDTVRFGR